MFQKREEYSWQNEYRVLIPPIENTQKQILKLGSIEDIAFGGDIEELRLGVSIGK